MQTEPPPRANFCETVNQWVIYDSYIAYESAKEAAEEMAVNVAAWPEKYGCDGIDLDLEEGAGSRREAGPNMIHFIRKIREIRKAAGLPRMIISQPTYGYPQVELHVPQTCFVPGSS